VLETGFSLRALPLYRAVDRTAADAPGSSYFLPDGRPSPRRNCLLVATAKAGLDLAARRALLNPATCPGRTCNAKVPRNLASSGTRGRVGGSTTIRHRHQDPLRSATGIPT